MSVIKGTNIVAGILPETANLLGCAEYMTTDVLQWKFDFTQMKGTRRIWGTRWQNFDGVAHWFHPTGGTKVNLFNEEHWFASLRTPTEDFTPALAISILMRQIDQCCAIDATCELSFQCDVQMETLGLKEDSWSEQVIMGLPKAYRKKISALNVHLYPTLNLNGQTNFNLDKTLNPLRVVKWLERIRGRMDELGMKGKAIIIGEVGLTDVLYRSDADGGDVRIDQDPRTPDYMANLYQAINARPDLNVSHIFPYCAGTHIGGGGDRYITLGEGNELSVYGKNYAAA